MSGQKLVEAIRRNSESQVLSSTKAVNFSSACATKRFPSPQCASTTDLALIAVVAQISPSHNDKDECRHAKDNSYA